MSLAFLEKLEGLKPFTENEAWFLYKVVAISEAVGWTILITGILIKKYEWPGHNIAVPIAGQIHGMIFLAYFGILLAVYTSIGWSRGKFLLAVLAGVPPYGSLIFEQWASYTRSNKNCRLHFRSILLSSVTNAYGPQTVDRIPES